MTLRLPKLLIDDCPECYDIAFEAISMIFRKCRGLVINSNGLWQPSYTLPPPTNPDQPIFVALARDHILPQPSRRRATPRTRPRLDISKLLAEKERQLARAHNALPPSIAHRKFVPCRPLTIQERRQLGHFRTPQQTQPTLPPTDEH